MNIEALMIGAMSIGVTSVILLAIGDFIIYLIFHRNLP